MRFTITIRGELGPLTVARLGTLGCRTDGRSRLAGQVRDQSELLEVLRSLHGLGLTLTHVQCDTGAPADPSVGMHRP